MSFLKLSDQIPVLFQWISTGLLQQDDAIVVAVQAARRRKRGNFFGAVFRGNSWDLTKRNWN